jgi:hypothetical protein
LAHAALVVCKWKYPDLTANVTASDFDRVAAVIKRKAMHLDLEKKRDRKQINKLLGMWKAAGSIAEYEDEDDTRQTRKFIKVKESGQ